MFHCFYSNQFWRQFEFYFYSITNRPVHLNLRDVLFGIITSKCILLNYLLIIGKLYFCDCRRNKVHPSIHGFQIKVKNKYEIEKYICARDNKMREFYSKWIILIMCYLGIGGRNKYKIQIQYKLLSFSGG